MRPKKTSKADVFHRCCPGFKFEFPKKKNGKISVPSVRSIVRNITSSVSNFFFQQQAQRREELLLALKIEELNEEAEMKERLNLERVFRRRIEIRLQLEQQKQDNLDRLAQEKNDDVQFRSEKLKLLSERDRIDQMTAEKRRRIMMEHHRAVREIMDQRKIAREEDKVKLADEHRYDLEQKEELYVVLWECSSSNGPI